MTTELDRLKEFFLVDGASYEQWTPHGESTEHLQVVGCTAEVLALIAEMDRLRHANAVLQTHARERSGERGKFIEAANAAYNAKRKLAEQDDAARDENARLTERVLELETVDNARLDELDVAWKKAARLEAELKELRARVAWLEASEEAWRIREALGVRELESRAVTAEALVMSHEGRIASLQEVFNEAYVTLEAVNTCRVQGWIWVVHGAGSARSMLQRIAEFLVRTKEKTT